MIKLCSKRGNVLIMDFIISARQKEPNQCGQIKWWWQQRAILRFNRQHKLFRMLCRISHIILKLVADSANRIRADWRCQPIRKRQFENSLSYTVPYDNRREVISSICHFVIIDNPYYFTCLQYVTSSFDYFSYLWLALNSNY